LKQRKRNALGLVGSAHDETSKSELSCERRRPLKWRDGGEREIGWDLAASRRYAQKSVMAVTHGTIADQSASW
jgi:hypothetical protein